MFSEQFKKSLQRTLVFVVIYTVAFVLFKETLKYTLPFVLALIIAALAKPFTNFLIKKLRFSNGLAAIFSTGIAFGTFFGGVFYLIYKISNQASSLLNSISMEYIQGMMIEVVNFIDGIWLGIDEELSNNLLELAQQMGSLFYDAAQGVLTALVAVTASIPYVLLVIITTLIATYFMTKELPLIEERFVGIFKPEVRGHIEEIWIQVKKMVFGYMKATMMLLLMSGFISFIGFMMLRIDYAFLLGFLCIILDLLPIVGMAIIYLAIGLTYLFQGNTFVAVALLVLYIIVVVVRQVLEPKFISDSIGLHPISVIVALFVGLTAFGFTGVIYLISLMVMYSVLRRVHVL